MFFLQMSGYPGSGKSTLARAIARTTGAIVVDHDIVKSSLLGAMESNIDSSLAGKISYDIDWSLVDFYLSQCRSVILDSPCLYSGLLDRGTELAKQYHVKYKYIECFLSDHNERDRRLRARQRMISQVPGVPAEVKDTLLTIESSSMKRPAEARYLIVDTSQPLEAYIDKVMEYINE